MDTPSPFWQRIIWVGMAGAFIVLSAFPMFSSVAQILQHLATLVVGGVLVSKPGDAPAPLVDIVQKVAASLNPPPLPPPENVD